MKKIDLFEKDLKTALANPEEAHQLLGEAKNRVLAAYEFTLSNFETDAVVFSEIFWERNYSEIYDYLKEAEVKELVLTTTSTELMDLLHFFSSKGGQIKEAVSISRKNKTVWDKPVKGIRIVL